MSADVQWLETTREVYSAIYSAFRGQMQVHGTISRSEDDWYGERHMMTEWGLPGADFPIIKHEDRGTPPEHRFFIAVMKENNDDTH